MSEINEEYYLKEKYDLKSKYIYRTGKRKI